MIDYITSQGDTWDIIALKTFGSEKYMRELINSNTGYRETVVFSGGIKLKIPQIETPIADNLPPWKRGG